MARTKKVGSAGRFGIRYGRKIRQKLIKVEKEMKSKHRCPNCLKPGMKRQNAGIWVCEKCGAKIAGKAYKPK